VLSTKHYINLGGSEMVVYRATPADIESGVQVGDLKYPGYPASGAKLEGVKISDPAVKIAFIALRYDQDVNTPMYAYAKDEAGNAARADFDRMTFPKPFKKSRIELDDAFLNRVIPAILETTTEVNPQGDMLQKFLAVNGDLRRKNAEKISSMLSQEMTDVHDEHLVSLPKLNAGGHSPFSRLFGNPGGRLAGGGVLRVFTLNAVQDKILGI